MHEVGVGHGKSFWAKTTSKAGGDRLGCEILLAGLVLGLSLGTALLESQYDCYGLPVVLGDTYLELPLLFVARHCSTC